MFLFHQLEDKFSSGLSNMIWGQADQGKCIIKTTTLTCAFISVDTAGKIDHFILYDSTVVLREVEKRSIFYESRLSEL